MGSDAGRDIDNPETCAGLAVSRERNAPEAYWKSSRRLLICLSPLLALRLVCLCCSDAVEVCTLHDARPLSREGDRK